MSYIVKTSFYEGNTLHEEGTVFEHEDKAYVDKCLADGNIAEATKGGSESTTPLVEQPVVSDSQENPQVSQPQPVEPTPVEPAKGQPTPAQIEAALAASEGASAPSDVHIS